MLKSLGQGQVELMQDEIDGLDKNLIQEEELHNLYNDYLIVPEQVEIKASILSDCCKEIASMYNIQVGGVKMLAPSLGIKDKYFFRYQNLNQE